MTFISSSIPSQSTQQLGNHPLMRPTAKQAKQTTQQSKVQPSQNQAEILNTATTPPKTATQKTSQLPDFLARKVHDIQNVAQKMGYIDLSEGAVVSAMRENRSLLADYRA